MAAVVRLLIGLLVLAGCGTVLADADRFKGVEITIGVQNAESVGAPARAHADTWEQRTGGKARLRRSDFGALYADYMAALQSAEPVYDVVFFPSAWTADFYPYLAEMPAELRESDAFDDIHPRYRESLMTWGGKWIAATVDGDLFSGYYRKDLFGDPANQVEFRARYGYELFPPDTWSQYRDIAEFFNGRRLPDGSPIYGTSEAFARNGKQIWTLFSRASAYTNHPDFPGAQFFDPDTMRAQVDNPGWLQAVRDYKEVLAFCPPGAPCISHITPISYFLHHATTLSR